jgi:hypothetical protein
MDTDDLSDEAYAIIADAHATSGLLGATLAVSGAKVRSESEFLRRMAATLREAAGGAEDYWEDHAVFTSASQFRQFCRALNRRVRQLRGRSPD